MISSINLIQDDALTLTLKPVADAAVVYLLKNTVYGTAGIRYRQTGQQQKIRQLHNPLFFHLYIDEALQGVYCLDHRVVTCPWGPIDAYYGRYLAIAEPYQRKGYGRLLKSEAVRYIERNTNLPYLLYSYIEERNTRSIRLSQQLDFLSIARLNTFVFRRLSPNVDPRVQLLPATERSMVIEALNTYYAGYCLKTFTKIGDNGNYFILKEGNELIAGVQANPVRWEFLHMPGAMGWAMMNIIPALPWLRNLFKPAYTFLALDSIYLRAGQEHYLPLLLESVLAHFKLNSALIQVDTRDKLMTILSLDKGPFSGFQANVSTHVLIKQNGLTSDQLTQLKQAPVYCSSFDYT